MSAWPSGILKSGSVGTKPFWACRRIVSMNRHGSSSKIADDSRPLPSRGVDGTMTFIPGMCMNQASSVCECVAPVASPPYTCVRTVIGAVVRPAVMKRSFAALLMSWSAAIPMKSMIMISATGSSPSIAAPIAAPTIAASEIGVSNTRSWPYLVDRPAVGPVAPGSAMSSPSRNTRSSACSASSSARLSASRIVISLSSMSLHRELDRYCVHVLVEFVDRRGVRAHHGFQRRFHRRCGLVLDAVELIRTADAGVGEVVAESRHRIGGHRRGQLILWGVGAPGAEIVAAETECHTFDERRAAAGACPLQRCVERSLNGKRVVAVDAHTRHAVAGRPLGDMFEFHGVSRRRHFCVEIVLAHKDDRQIPQRGHVGRFVE